MEMNTGLMLAYVLSGDAQHTGNGKASALIFEKQFTTKGTKTTKMASQAPT